MCTYMPRPLILSLTKLGLIMYHQYETLGKLFFVEIWYLLA